MDTPNVVLMWLGAWEIGLIVLIALVVFGFGARKLPDIGKGLGEGITNFRKALTGHDGSSDREEDDRPAKD